MMRPATLFLCLAFALGLPLVLPVSSARAETLVLNTAHSAPRSLPDRSGYEDHIVIEAFQRLGLNVRLMHLPSERAIKNAEAGIDDGNFSRVAGLSAQYPNLIMVPEAVDEFVFTAFTKNPTLQVNGWEGLKPHSVGRITGWKIVEANTAGVSFLTCVHDERALFTLLERGRAEVVVADLLLGQEVVRRMGLTGVRALAPPLERRDMYIYLHKRHAELVPRLAEVLRQMKRDGTFQRLRKNRLAEARQ